MPALVYDKIDVEDLDSDGEDHACDALRYGPMCLPGNTMIPLEVMDPEYLIALQRADHKEHERERRNRDLVAQEFEY